MVLLRYVAVAMSFTVGDMENVVLSPAAAIASVLLLVAFGPRVLKATSLPLVVGGAGMISTSTLFYLLKDATLGDFEFITPYPPVNRLLVFLQYHAVPSSVAEFDSVRWSMWLFLLLIYLCCLLLAYLLARLIVRDG